MKITLISFQTQNLVLKQSKNILINVEQILPIRKKSIIDYLIKHDYLNDKEDLENLNLITMNPRSYFLDVMLNKNKELNYVQQNSTKNPSAIVLPCELQLVLPQEQYSLSSNSNIQPSLEHFQILQKIGQGTYSQIFLVEFKFNRVLYCLKRINKAECKEKGHIKMIMNESQILEDRSRWRIHMFYRFQDKINVYFVIDYCPFGDLYSILQVANKSQSQKININDKYTMWIQIAMGVVALHQKGFVYRDLKPENVLINQNGQIRLCDFGFAYKIEENEKLTQICGSYQYLAPQMLKNQGYDKSLDIYCLGLLLYEMVVGNNPFEGITSATIQQIKNKHINYDQKNLTPNIKDLLKKMLKEKPEERLGYFNTMDLFKHQFFKDNESLIFNIINKKIKYSSNLSYIPPRKLEERKSINSGQKNIFYETYNYLIPNFDVKQNIGPKFSYTS